MRGRLATAGDGVPRLDVAHVTADLLDDAGGAVPERVQHLEAAANGGNGRGQPVHAHLVEHLAHVVRPAPRLAEETAAGRLDLRTLGSDADERRLRADEHLPVVELGRGDVEHAELAVLQALRKLLHGAVTSRASI